ncbi:PilZ domain-containing protein [Vibrio ruber]|uniref:Cyclic diguanosine monophosphate-binding protein n=1 Tax=Vibrio ruber (strain DSM 16370 / JCM 11486 / BCRC 17186 / CECT 7878 / LMG 23124 / VR1) TaxID=1123498 RepID=A0A1R4LB83_VIBR1|nr:PilZ domain-containing protein [Vibrio ruber]WNJ96043.1 PilZ domain-containing protein [Vibrio ruber]SJN53826.1 Cyclic diguanosine monophosphate-binding protein [Vibrio ruber DSM 16370]
MAEKRRFSRIIYRAPALLTQGSVHIATTVQDLSLHGILLSVIGEPRLDPHQPVYIEFPLPESDISIQMTANIVSLENSILHASIAYIDVESISHLKRLIELNVGDDALLHRELEHLTDLGDESDTPDSI